MYACFNQKKLKKTCDAWNLIIWWKRVLHLPDLSANKKREKLTGLKNFTKKTTKVK